MTPWASCFVVFSLDLVDLVEDGLAGAEGRVRSALPVLPEGWRLGSVVGPGDGGPARAVFAVVGRFPSLLDGCSVLRGLMDAGLSSGPPA